MGPEQHKFDAAMFVLGLGAGIFSGVLIASAVPNASADQQRLSDLKACHETIAAEAETCGEIKTIRSLRRSLEQR